MMKILRTVMYMAIAIAIKKGMNTSMLVWSVDA